MNKPMNMKTNNLIKWWNGRKENAKKKAIAAFKSDYKVSEKDGKIYLIHNGYAFAVVKDNTSASEIAAKLNAARDAALEYEGLWK